MNLFGFTAVKEENVAECTDVWIFFKGAHRHTNKHFNSWSIVLMVKGIVHPRERFYPFTSHHFVNSVSGDTFELM